MRSVQLRKCKIFLCAIATNFFTFCLNTAHTPRLLGEESSISLLRLDSEGFTTAPGLCCSKNFGLPLEQILAAPLFSTHLKN